VSDIQIVSHQTPVLVWFSYTSQKLHTSTITPEALKSGKFSVSNQGEFNRGSVNGIRDIGLLEKAKVFVLEERDGKENIILVKDNGEANKVWDFPSVSVLYQCSVFQLNTIHLPARNIP
jgi:hypothetical protein